MQLNKDENAKESLLISNGKYKYKSVSVCLFFDAYYVFTHF